MIAIWRFSTRVVEIDTFQLLLDLPHAGQQVHHAAHAAELLQLPELIGEVFEIEGAFAHALGDLLRLVVIDFLCRALDQADHVAHAENASGNALGMKVLQPVELFAGTHQLDRLAGHRPHGKRRAATAIAVDARQHDAGNPDLLVEGAGEIDRVLSGQRIGDQQCLVGLGDIAHRRGFGQQLLIDMQPARRIEHHDVIAALAGFRHGALGNLHRCFALDDGQRVDTHLAAENGELFLCRRPPGIERRHQHLALVAVLEASCDLGGGRGLA